MRVGVSSVDTRSGGAAGAGAGSRREMVGADLSAEVTTAEAVHGRRRWASTGSRSPRSTSASSATSPRRLAARGVTTHVLPATSTLDDLLATGADAVFFSPGPGDPATADHAVELAREVMRRRIPLFGICFGSQILGRALGFGTYKLGYGHRGINQPVLDRTTGKVEVTSHNHGFAVDAPLRRARSTPSSARSRCSHVCLNDNVVEGLRATTCPAFTVQYHPEAAAGPHDADYLFDRFVELDRRAAHA